MSREGLAHDALEALDHHLRHWSVIDTAPYRFYTEVLMAAYIGADPDDIYGSIVDDWLRDESAAWDYGPTVVLADDPFQFVSEASERMPDALLTADVVPTSGGVLMRPGLQPLIDYSIPDPDHPGETWDVLAIAWRSLPRIALPDGTEGAGVDVWLYGGRGHFSEAGISHPFLDDWPTPFVPIDRIPWAFNTPWKGLAEPTVREPRGSGHEIIVDDDGVVLADPHVARVRRFLLALWSFMADEVVESQPQRLPRPSMKRLARSGRMAEIPEDGALRIVHLRRYAETDSDTETDPDAEPPYWSHRWYVRGHWRRLASGRVTWVRPHVKGPEDRPLVLKNNIVAVHR